MQKDIEKTILEKSMWCADGSVCKLPKGSKGIDWGYGGSKIYDDAQLYVESDDNIIFKTGGRDRIVVNNAGVNIKGDLNLDGRINIAGWKVEGGPQNSLVFRRGDANNGNDQPYLRMGKDGNFWVSRSTARGWVPDNIQALNRKTQLMNWDGKMSGGARNNWAFGGKDLSDMYDFYNDRGNYVKKGESIPIATTISSTSSPKNAEQAVQVLANTAISPVAAPPSTVIPIANTAIAQMTSQTGVAAVQQLAQQAISPNPAPPAQVAQSVNTAMAAIATPVASETKVFNGCSFKGKHNNRSRNIKASTIGQTIEMGGGSRAICQADGTFMFVKR